MKFYVYKVFRSILISCTSFMIASVVARFAIPWAAAERGYDGAYGGEWALIIGAFFLSYWALSKLTEAIEKDIRKTMGCRQGVRQRTLTPSPRGFESRQPSQRHDAPLIKIR